MIGKLRREFQSGPVRFSRKVADRLISHLVTSFKLWVVRDPQAIEVRRWVAARGDETLRINYALQPTSVVFDLGGYVGDFAEKIQASSRCRVHVFEPAHVFFQACEKRFEDFPNVTCHNFAVSDADGVSFLSEAGDGSSIKEERLSESVVAEKVEVRSFERVIAELGINEIDLLKINIEGGEYDVLPHLIATGLVRRVRHIQIQFHRFIANAEAKREKILDALNETHESDWCYPFVWESWSRREGGLPFTEASETTNLGSDSDS